MPEATIIVDPSRMARIATVLTWVWFGFDVRYGLASLDRIAALGGLGGAVAPLQRLHLSDHIVLAASLALLASKVSAGIAILRWIYIVNRNAHGLGGRMTTSPGWTVAWFFVPVLNLWKPYGGVRESWQATVNPSSPRSARVPSVMRRWWGAWLVSSGLSIVSGRVAYGGKATHVVQANWLSVATLPLDLMLTLSLIAVVRRLSRLQTAAPPRSDAAARADAVSDAAPQAARVRSESPV